MADEPRKRSRFDQPPEAVRKSRFDRRSRSPAQHDTEPGRHRSPAVNEGEDSGDSKKMDAAAAAAAAAARINASINAKKAIQRVDVPPIRAASSPGAAMSPSASTPNDPNTSQEVYTQDGDFIKDIEINDLRNRYTLTKGSTQKMIKEKTGADVTTRGNYVPDKSMATAANPPLYLHVTSTTKDGLEKAIAEIDELMKQELPNLIDERRFRRREPEQQVERDHLGRRKWPDERIPIDLEPIHGFNLRAQVVGQGGSYVKYIQQETRCRVQIKGRGSGFVEHDTGRESDEPMYLHVQGPDADEVQRAKQMSEELLATVRESYDRFKEQRNQRPYGGGGGGGGRGGYGQNGDHDGGPSGNDQYGHGIPPPPPPDDGGQQAYGGYGGQSTYSNPSYSAPGASMGTPEQQAIPGAGAQQQQGSIQDWINYYAAHPEQDPYIQYGGYAAIMQQYYQQAGQAAPGQPTNGASAQSPPPPPPPPGSDIPQPGPPGT